jgi:hypothetical protein
MRALYNYLVFALMILCFYYVNSQYDVSCSWVKFAYPCPTQADYVCGYYYQDSPNCVGSCNHTYRNGCEACYDGVSGYNLGQCPINEPVEQDCIDKPLKPYICKDSDRKKKCKCKEGNNFVCATLFSKCPEGSCTSYYKCKCEACANDQVYSVNKGLCDIDSNLEDYALYICKETDRNKLCTKQYEGVCALANWGITSEASICSACSRQDVVAVFKGECRPIAVYSKWP